MATNVTTLADEILEKTTPKLTAVLKDEDGNPIADTDLVALELTLYSMEDPPTHTIINSRSAQDVLNKDNVTVDGSGNLTWEVQAEDTAILDGSRTKERHRAVFDWTYNAGAKRGRHIIDMTVRNLEKVT